MTDRDKVKEQEPEPEIPNSQVNTTKTYIEVPSTHTTKVEKPEKYDSVSIQSEQIEKDIRQFVKAALGTREGSIV